MSRLQNSSYVIFITTDEYYNNYVLSKYIDFSQDKDVTLRKLGRILGFLSKHSDQEGTMYIVKDIISYEQSEEGFSLKFKIELCITFLDENKIITQEEMDKRIAKLNETLSRTHRKILDNSIPLESFTHIMPTS